MEDPFHVRVKLADPAQLNERSDGTPRVCWAREEQHVGTRPDSLPRPALNRCVMDEREGVRDRDTVEPETPQQPVGLRFERCSVARAIKSVTDHDTAEAGRDCMPIRAEVLRPDARVNVRPCVG